MAAEEYEAIDPPSSLAPFVHLLWRYRSDEPSGAIQRIAPDGCPELVFDLGSPYEEQGHDGVFRQQPRVIFTGQLTRPLSLRPTGPVEVVSARFHPDGARDWLGGPMTRATDHRLDLSERFDSLPPRGDGAAQFEWICERLEAHRQQHSWTLDPLVRTEVEAAQADQPSAPLSPADRRALQRRFADRVGAPPRLLRSVLRFRKVFDQAEALGWLEAGLAAGYFDQPQMARDFRRFLGCTATQWAREQLELAHVIASQTYKPDDQATR